MKKVPVRKIRTFKKQSEYELTEDSFDKVEGESQTVPNQAFTVAEILKKHQQGISPAIMKRALYELDEFNGGMNPLRKPGLDLTDVDEIAEQVNETYKRLKLEAQKKRLSEDEEEKRKVIEGWIKDQPDLEIKSGKIIQKVEKPV